MPIVESRVIHLCTHSLRAAMQAHGPELAPGIVPATTTVKSVTISSIDPPKVAFDLFLPELGSSRKVELGGNALMQLVMRMCREHRIPLPRHAAKEMRADPQGIALTVRLTHKAGWRWPTAGVSASASGDSIPAGKETEWAE